MVNSSHISLLDSLNSMTKRPKAFTMTVILFQFPSPISLLITCMSFLCYKLHKEVVSFLKIWKFVLLIFFSQSSIQRLILLERMNCVLEVNYLREQVTKTSLYKCWRNFSNIITSLNLFLTYISIMRVCVTSRCQEATFHNTRQIINKGTPRVRYE